MVHGQYIDFGEDDKVTKGEYFGEDSHMVDERQAYLVAT